MPIYRLSASRPPRFSLLLLAASSRGSSSPVGAATGANPSMARQSLRLAVGSSRRSSLGVGSALGAGPTPVCLSRPSAMALHTASSRGSSLCGGAAMGDGRRRPPPARLSPSRVRAQPAKVPRGAGFIGCLPSVPRFHWFSSSPVRVDSRRAEVPQRARIQASSKAGEIAY